MSATRTRRLRAFLGLAAASLALAAAAAPFTPGNVVVYRAGSGTGALLATGNPVFLDEYTPGGTLVQSIALPTVASGAQKALLASGTATSDGLLTRSVDGTCLVAPGYARDLGQAGGNLTTGTVGTGGPPIPRVVGRVTAAGAIDTSTVLTDAALGSNFRGAASTDCNALWVSGTTGTGLTGGGVRYTTLGATTSTDITTSSFANTRAVAIYDGQLYGSLSVSTLRGVASVGSGTPTTSAAVTKLPGLTDANSPGSYAFFLADLNPAVPGVDTLYVADEDAGLTKFSLVGSTWVANGVIGTATDVYRGITGVVNGSTVTLYATRRTGAAATPGGELVTLTDASGHNGALAGTPTVLATAGTNRVFRGVALAPAITITPSAGANGTISPSTPQTVAGSATRAFTVTPAAGYAAVVGGTCGGSLSGTTFTTDPVNANCTVIASFTLIPTFVVTPSAGPNGSITPPSPRTLLTGATTSFTVAANAGYAASVGGTCGGTFDGTTYTTAPVTADCTVVASFTLITYTVTSSAGPNGGITPIGAQPIPGGTTAAFTVTPAAGYAASVGGTCGGSLSGNAYTTVPVTQDCTVSAAFTPIPIRTVTASAGPNGSIAPAGTQGVLEGETVSIAITPAPGYRAAVRGTCGGTLTGNTYVTRPVAADCTVLVAFANKIVLFVGNSYTFGRIDPVMSYNAANVTDLTMQMWIDNPAGSNADEPHPWGGIPGVFKKLTTQAGLDWDVSISARNAASLRGHYANTNPAGWDLRGNIASQQWDIVVLQDLSDEPLPAGRGANANLPYFNAYVDKIEAWIHGGAAESYTETQLYGGTIASCRAITGASENQCELPRIISPANANARATTEIVLYQTWARPDMIAPHGTNESGTFYSATEGLEAMTADFHSAYFGRAAANPRIADVSPVGDAFLRAVRDGIAMRDPYVPEAGKVNLWHTDFFHPSKYGSYLSALVHFATLTGMNPMMFGAGDLAAADLGIAAADAVALQRIARATVFPDTTPPTTLASMSEPPNAQGWNRNPVTVTFTATDNAGGWGVGAITYAMSGAQTASGPLPSGGSVTISSQGTTTLTYFATDAAGNVEAAHTLVVRVDSTAPVFAALANFSVDATSPAGAVVTFSATATDNSGLPPGVSCAPASGATMPIGATTIVCTGIDAAGNTATATFKVTVDGAAPQTARLIAAVLALRGINVPPGTVTALTTHLQQALSSSNDTLFCIWMNLFMNQLTFLSGRVIPAAQAAPLIASANRIRAVQGCR